MYEYSKFRKNLNFTIVDTDWGVDGYPKNHKFCWTYFSNGEFVKKERIDVTEYLDSSIKSYPRASEVHGIGLFALVDIKKGEQVFPKWKGKTDWYKLKFSETKHLPGEVLQYILRSFGSKIVNDDSEIRFKLTKDCNFLFSDPLCLLNTKYEEGSIDAELWEKYSASPGALLPIRPGVEKPTPVMPAPLANAFFQIVQEGKHDELVNIDGLYKQLHKMQFRT